jgi:hypothetical protein
MGDLRLFDRNILVHLNMFILGGQIPHLVADYTVKQTRCAILPRVISICSAHV